MFLQSIEMHGFKSFASKTVLEFSAAHGNERGITAVVGPNGSGKSNIADAIRWVLGEQSYKLLRGKRSEDVVFAGSGKKARMGMAEVSLTINNTDGVFPLEFPEVVITRRLYRDGESEYLLQNEKVRLLDLQLLLARAGIGGRSYTVIGQGMVDHVLLSSPAERKDFFDEAAGVKELELKRRQSTLKLQASREQIAGVQTIILELEPRLRTLSRQVARFDERATVEVQWQQAGRAYFGGVLQDIATMRAALDMQERALKEPLAQARARRAELEGLLVQLEQAPTKSSEALTLQETYRIPRRAFESTREERMRLTSERELLKARAQVKVSEGVVPRGEVGLLFEQLSTRIDALVARLSIANLETLPEIISDSEGLASTIMTYKQRYGVVVQPKPTAEIAMLDSKITDLLAKEQEIQAQMRAIESEQTRLASGEQAGKVEFFEAQRTLQQAITEVHTIEAKMSSGAIERARLDGRLENITEEMNRDFQGISVQPAVTSDPTSARARWYEVKRTLESIGSIDEGVRVEYQEVQARYTSLSTQVNDITATIASLEEGLRDLTGAMKTRRTELFGTLSTEFNRYFATLFSGGTASITPVYATEAESSEEDLVGVEIQAQPPGKRIKDIGVLSGGERAMTSVALICAILSVNPSPFVVLDEVDAALDEANAVRYAAILEHLSEKTQFIIVTHNRSTMNKAKVLYGVTMGEDGVSQLLSVILEKAMTWAK